MTVHQPPFKATGQLVAADVHSPKGTEFPLHQLNERDFRSAGLHRIEQKVLSRSGVRGKKERNAANPAETWFTNIDRSFSQCREDTWAQESNTALVGLLECARSALDTLPRTYMERNRLDTRCILLHQADELLRALVDTLEEKTIPLSTQVTRKIVRVRSDKCVALYERLRAAAHDSGCADRNIFDVLANPRLDFEAACLRSVSSNMKIMLDWATL